MARNDFFGVYLDRSVAFLFGADADNFLNIGDENFSIADLAGLGRTDNGGDGTIHPIIRQHDFDFDFRQEIDLVFGPSIDFSVPFLASETFDLADSHSFDPYLAKRILHLLKFEGFDNRLNFFHFGDNFSASIIGRNRY